MEVRSIDMMSPRTDLPDAAAVDRLIAIVEARWPLLKPTDEEPHHRRAFVHALYFCRWVQRSDRLNSERSTAFFVGEADRWCAQYALGGRISDKSFTAAAVASGIRTSPLDRWPFDTEYAAGLGTAAVPNNDWRKVIAAGQPFDPLPLRRPEPPIRRQLVQQADDWDGTVPRGSRW